MSRATAVDSIWVGELASDVSIGGGSLTLTTVAGTNWPSSGTFGVQVGDDPDTDAEVVQVTRSGTTLTLDSMTLAKAHLAGVNVYLLLTAADMNAKISDPGGSDDDYLTLVSGTWVNRTMANLRDKLRVLTGWNFSGATSIASGVGFRSMAAVIYSSATSVIDFATGSPTATRKFSIGVSQILSLLPIRLSVGYDVNNPQIHSASNTDTGVAIEPTISSVDLIADAEVVFSAAAGGVTAQKFFLPDGGFAEGAQFIVQDGTGPYDIEPGARVVLVVGQQSIGDTELVLPNTTSADFTALNAAAQITVIDVADAYNDIAGPGYEGASAAAIKIQCNGVGTDEFNDGTTEIQVNDDNGSVTLMGEGFTNTWHVIGRRP